MEKILKRLFLFTFIFLIPKNVFADSVPIRFDIGSIFNSYFVSSDNSTETAINNFYDTQFSIYLVEQQNFLNYFVYYDKVYDKYIFFFINNNSQTQPENRSVYLRRNEKYWNAFDITNSFSYSKLHFYILSNESDTSYYNSIFNKNYNNSPNFENTYFGYYYSFDGTELTYSMDLITNNTDRFDFVYIFKNDLYINDIKQEISSSSEEPEDPEEEIPSYNFNNNKFYVPNYEIGNCVEVLDKDTIRVFKDNSTDFYTDYFINSNYISKTGQVDISYEKKCSNLEFTDIRYYGNDLPQIIIITLTIIAFTILPCYLLWKIFYKRS